MNENLPTFLMCEVRKESHVPLDNYISLNMVENFTMKLELVASSERCEYLLISLTKAEP